MATAEVFLHFLINCQLDKKKFNHIGLAKIPKEILQKIFSLIVVKVFRRLEIITNQLFIESKGFVLPQIQTPLVLI